MSGFEKFFVNRVSERTGKAAFEAVRASLAVPNNASILELGAGRGTLSLRVSQLYNPKRLAVTDYDQLQVDAAREHFLTMLGTLPTNVEFRVADALNLPFGDGSFDVVFANHVLHHVEKHEWHFRNIPEALDEVGRILKPNGSFVYWEIFKKDAIRRYLIGLGFESSVVKSYWRISEFCVFRKAGPRASAETVEATGAISSR